MDRHTRIGERAPAGCPPRKAAPVRRSKRVGPPGRRRRSRPPTVAYFLARSHALSGGKEAALKWLDQALKFGLRSRERIRNDEAFASLRDDPAFQALAGVVDTARMSRAEGWRYDLSFLEREV